MREGFQIIQPIETVEYPTKSGAITCFGGIPREDLVESWQVRGRDGFGRKTVVTPAVVEFVGQNFFSPSPIALEKATAIFMLQGEMNYEM